MKYEPLKLKDLKQNVREIFADKEKFAYIQNSARRKMDHEYGFLHAISIVEGRVKSAVQGLLKDIEKLESEITDEYKNEWLNTPMKHYCISLLNECKGLVKKWFADVVEE